MDESNDDQSIQWLKNKVVQCGMAAGVTVDSTTRGWDGVIQFSLERENQNKGELDTGRSKKKGARELRSRNGFINYDRIRKQEEERRLLVKEMVRKNKVQIAMLQESKISSMFEDEIKEVWGRRHVNWNCLDADGIFWGNSVIVGQLLCFYLPYMERL